VPPAVPDASDDTPSVLLGEVEHSDATASGGQLSADSLADPGAAAGDERDLTPVPTRGQCLHPPPRSPLRRRCRLDQGARASADSACVAVRATSANGDFFTSTPQGRFWYQPADRRERARIASG
jgi:hypothetical protein